MPVDVLFGILSKSFLEIQCQVNKMNLLWCIKYPLLLTTADARSQLCRAVRLKDNIMHLFP